MSAMLNLLFYQGVWFAAVLGAGRGSATPGLMSFGAFAAGQLALSHARSQDLQLVALALSVGLALDGTLSFTGLVQYAAAAPALPIGGAPLWILALWGAFALTLNHSLAWLRSRRFLAALLGAIGGPLAYLAAARLAGAVHLPAPHWRAVAVLGAGWSAALVLLTEAAASGARPPPTAAQERHL